jgi:pimeloyl-ACP methyl ester carboxylesterase
MPEAKVNGIRMHYEVSGSGPNLVLVHGMSVDRRMWDDQVKEFSKDYRVITYDSRGHGKTEAPQTGYGAEDRIEDLYQLLRHLNVQRATVMGLSMGAGTAFGFAVRHPEMVEALVVADGAPAVPPPPGAPRAVGNPQINEFARQGKMKDALDLWLQAPVFAYTRGKPQAWQKLESMVREHPGAIWRDPQAGTYPVADDLARAASLKMPTLFIYGDHELPNIVQNCEKAMAAMPQAKKVVVGDAGHMANLDQPAEFNNAVRGFLASVKAAPARR